MNATCVYGRREITVAPRLSQSQIKKGLDHVSLRLVRHPFSSLGGSEHNVLSLPGFITSHTLKRLTYMHGNGTIKSSEKKGAEKTEEVEGNKNKFSNIVL